MYLRLREHIKRYFKLRAQASLPERVFLLSKRSGLRYCGLKLRFSRSRWGSCNARNEIVLNTQLVRLPQYLRDYVIYHELVHTKIKNHSESFKSMLDGLLPHRRRNEKGLKNYFLLY